MTFVILGSGNDNYNNDNNNHDNIHNSNNDIITTIICTLIKFYTSV